MGRRIVHGAELEEGKVAGRLRVARLCGASEGFQDARRDFRTGLTAEPDPDPHGAPFVADLLLDIELQRCSAQSIMDFYSRSALFGTRAVHLDAKSQQRNGNKPERFIQRFDGTRLDVTLGIREILHMRQVAQPVIHANAARYRSRRREPVRTCGRDEAVPQGGRLAMNRPPQTKRPPC